MRFLFFWLCLAALCPGTVLAITVPNFSFETPNIVYASDSNPTGWSTVEPAGQQVGLFDNPGAGVDDPDDHIDNVDGGQAAFFFAAPGVSLFQELPSTYQVGTAYTLTIAVGAGGGGMSLGSTLQLRFYYRDTANAKVYLAASDVIFDAAFASRDPAPINHLYDYSAALGAVKAGDAWAGKAIGIEFTDTVGTGGYFDLDNVRLIPEPGSALLLALGLATLSARRFRQAWAPA